MTHSEELAHVLFGQLHDPNRTASDLELITAMFESVTQELDEVSRLWKLEKETV